MNYYIYLHKTLDCDVPFYVGKGNKRRAYIKRNRSDFWKRVVSKHGYKIEFLEQNLDEDLALEREKYWIGKFGRRDLKTGTLVNFTDGGEGTVRRIVSVECRRAVSEANKKRIASEINRKQTGSLYKDKFGALHNRSKAVECSNGNIYGSMSEASRKLSMSVSSVSWSIKNNKPIYGYNFQIAINENLNPSLVGVTNQSIIL